MTTEEIPYRAIDFFFEISLTHLENIIKQYKIHLGIEKKVESETQKLLRPKHFRPAKEAWEEMPWMVPSWSKSLRVAEIVYKARTEIQ